MRLLVALLGCCFVDAAVAAVAPDWSVELGANVQESTPLRVQALGITDPGHGLFLSSVGVEDRVAVLAIGANGLVRDQFVASSQVSQDSSTVLLASNATGAVVVVFVGSSPGTLHRLDAAGRSLWRRDRDVDQARLLANGDVLVLDGDVLTRLSALDGSVRWGRNLLDVADDSWSGEYRLGEGTGAQIDIMALFLSRRLANTAATPRHWKLAIDVDTGELRWATPVPVSATSIWAPRCTPTVWGADRVDVHFEGAQVADVAVVERRRRSDGQLLWSRRIPAAYADHGLCTLSVSDEVMYLSFDEGQTPGRLIALDAAGDLRWQRELSSARQVQMLPTTGDDLILAEAVYGFPDSPQHLVSRWRAADGKRLWSFAVPAVQLDLRGDGTSFALAWVAETSNPTMPHYQRYDTASGVELGDWNAAVFGFRAAPVATVAWAGNPCSAEVSAASPASIDLVCLHEQTGLLIWQASTPPLDSAESITALQWSTLGANLLLLRATTVATTPDGDLRRDHLYALDAVTGLVQWHSIRLGFLGLIAGADDDVYVNDRDCVDPTACASAPYLLRKLAGASGAEIWRRPFGLSPLAAGAGLMVGWRQETGLRGFQALDAGTGAERWFRAVSSTGQVVPTALVTASGALLLKHEPSNGASRSVEVRRVSLDDGSELYSLAPSIPAQRTESALLHESSDGKLLLSATQTTGAWLMRTQLADGAPDWQIYPPATPPEFRSVRFPGAAPTGHWAYQIRMRGDQLERRALSRMQPEDGALMAEHLYATAVRSEGSDFGSVTLLSVSVGGQALAVDRSYSVQGVQQTRLQRWPVASDVTGDVRIQFGSTEPGSGMGASIKVTLLVANNSSQLVPDLLVSAGSELSTLWFQLRGCEPVVACGQPAAGADSMHLSMPAHSQATVTFEVHDPGYRPQARLGEDVAVFRVDTPFELGDLDLGNNVISVPVRLGGMADGFE